MYKSIKFKQNSYIFRKSFLSLLLGSLLLLSLDNLHHSCLNSLKSFSLFLHDLLKFWWLFLNQWYFSEIKINRFLCISLHKKSCTILNQVYLLTLYLYKILRPWYCPCILQCREHWIGEWGFIIGSWCLMRPWWIVCPHRICRERIGTDSCFELRFGFRFRILVSVVGVIGVRIVGDRLLLPFVNAFN